MRNAEETIDVINKLIFESIIHGGDSGGPYCVNEEELLNAINKWIARVHLSDKYTAKTVLVYTNYPAVPQIVSI